MGEIYRARDTRLERDVAVKVLPAEFGEDPSRLRRFEHEGRAMCRLNHPNIISVYDVGHEGSTPYIVTELLQGETLRDRLSSGPVPARQAAAWAAAVARGLASAHENGIVHRDLKPANLFITRDGHVKILDFGLAKLTHPEWDRADAEGDTVSMISRPGLIVGSAGYMSPEQVEGAPVDHRSDIFSLGTILYEMLSGEKAFRRGAVVETLHSILKDDPPDIRAALPDIDESLGRIVMRCLEKSPSARFAGAADLAFSLEDAAERSLSGTLARRVRRRVALSRAVVAFAIAGLAITTLSVLTARTYSSIDLPALRVSVQTRVKMTRVTTSGTVGAIITISPDGNYVAWDQTGDTFSLWLTHIPSASSTRIVDDALGAAQFSPDGNFIYYVSWSAEEESSGLFRVPLLGGPSHLVVRDVTSGVLTFSPDAARVAYVRRNRDSGDVSLVTATVTGGNEVTVTTVSKGRELSGCAWSPDGARFLCVQGVGDGHAGVMVDVDAVTGVISELPDFPHVSDASWTPDGRAVVGGAGVISRVEYPGGAVEHLTGDLSEYYAASLSRDGGTIAAVRVDNATNLWTMRVGDTQSLRQITSGLNTYDGNQGVATTPDGRIVFASSLSGKSTDLWICDADGGNRRRLTFDDDAHERRPDVSPDGRTILYIRETGKREEDEAANIWTTGLAGGAPRQLTHHGGVRLPRFTADGSRIVYSRRIEGTDWVWEIPASGGEPRQLVDRPAWAPAESPDGRWLAVTANGRVELLPTAGGEAKVLAFDAGGKQWKPDGSGFLIGRGGNLSFYDLRSDRLEPLTRFGPAEPRVAWALAWFPDGERVVFPRRSSTRDVVVLQLTR